MDIGEKAFWFVLFAGSASAIIYGALKIGEVVVRRRTNAMIAAHAEVDDKDDEGEEKPPTS